MQGDLFFFFANDQKIDHRAAANNSENAPISKNAARQLPPILSSKEKGRLAGGLFSIFVKFLLLPPVYHMGGGGQANFTGKCTNFLNGAASPARNGAPANCAGAASAAGERPAGRFPPFPRPRAKGRSRPPRLGRRGPRPGESQRPPRARSRARAGGADDRHQPGPGETAGAARAPGRHRPRSRAANFGGPAPGRGARRPPSGRPFNAAPSSNGGSGGSPRGETLPERRGSRLASRGHEERATKTSSSKPAASERAAQGARAPPPRRCPAYAGRGCSEGSCCSIRCAAAWRPVAHALPRILLRVIPGW